MTYAVDSAIGKAFGSDGLWEEFDVLPMNCREILSTYQQVRINLINPYGTPGQTEGLDITEIRSGMTEFEGTFEEYLVHLGNDALPTTNLKYSIKECGIRYGDLFLAGYTTLPVNHKFAPDADLPIEDKESIFLTKPDISYKDFFDHCLVTVNGMLHYTEYSSDGLWVLGGMRNVLNRNNNHMGILNFKQLGSIKTKLITPTMIYKHQTDVPLYYQTNIDVGEDITNKTVILVIGGYIHINDSDVFKITGMNTLKINWDRIPLAKRIMETHKSVNYVELGLEKNDENSFVFKEDLTSDKFLTNYLNTFNSFIVLLDNPEIRVAREYVEPTMLPGSYLYHKEPKLPLITGIGRLAEYWTMEEDDLWSVDISTDAVDYPKHNFKTTAMKDIYAMDAKMVPNERAVLSHAFFLDIGSNFSAVPQ